MMRLFIVFLSVFVLGGCGFFGGGIDIEQLGQDGKGKLREIIRNAELMSGEFEEPQAKADEDKLLGYRQVEIPKDMPFLADSINISYGNLDPKVLFESIVGFPVRFDLIYPVTKVSVHEPRGAITIKDHLDSIAGQLNWTYGIENSVMVVSDWEYRVIELSALVGSVRAVIKSGSLASVGDTDNVFRVDVDPYQEIEDLVRGILGIGARSTRRSSEDDEEGVVPDVFIPVAGEARAQVSRSANLLYISAPPNKVKEVYEVLEKYNESVNQKVVITINTYDVSLSDSDNRSLDLSLLREATNTVALSSTGVPLGVDVRTGAFDAVSPFSPSVPDDSLSLGLNYRDGSFTANLLLAWLDTQGTVVDTNQRRFEALNNNVVSITNTSNIDYIEERKIEREESQSGTSIVSPSVVIGQHVVGDVFNLLPTIVDGRVNIKLSIIDRAIVSATPYGDAVLSGTLFEISNSDRVVSMSLVDGETRLITYLRSDLDVGRSVDNKLLPFLGDKNSQESRKIETVIVVKAEIVD